MTRPHAANPRTLSSAQVARTLEFLATFKGDHQDASTNAAASFARSCVLLTSGDRKGATAEADEFARWVAAQPDVRSLELDPLVLAAYAFELQRDEAVPKSFDHLTDALTHAIATLPPGECEHPRARLTERLLSEAGSSSATSPPRPRRNMPEIDGTKLLTAPDDELSETIDRLAAERSEIAGPVAWTLSLLALGMLRTYKIELATKILRVLIESGHSSDLMEEALNFVALQRCSDGGYGFADPFIDDDDGIVGRDLRFRLPITVNAVWLLRTASATRPADTTAPPSGLPA